MRVIHCPLTPSLKKSIKGMWIIEEDCGIEVDVNCFPVGYPFINVISGSKFLLHSEFQTEVESYSYLAGASNSPFKLTPYFYTITITSAGFISPNIHQNPPCISSQQIPHVMYCLCFGKTIV